MIINLKMDDKKFLPCTLPKIVCHNLEIVEKSTTINYNDEHQHHQQQNQIIFDNNDEYDDDNDLDETEINFNFDEFNYNSSHCDELPKFCIQSLSPTSRSLSPIDNISHHNHTTIGSGSNISDNNLLSNSSHEITDNYQSLCNSISYLDLDDQNHGDIRKNYNKKENEVDDDDEHDNHDEDNDRISLVEIDRQIQSPSSTSTTTTSSTSPMSLQSMSTNPLGKRLNLETIFEGTILYTPPKKMSKFARTALSTPLLSTPSSSSNLASRK